MSKFVLWDSVISGISQDLIVYDAGNVADLGNLSQKERAEMADVMIIRWQQFWGNIAKPAAIFAPEQELARAESPVYRPTRPGEVEFVWSDSWCFKCPCGGEVIVGDGDPKTCDCGRLYRMPTFVEVAEPSAEIDG